MLFAQHAVAQQDALAAAQENQARAALGSIVMLAASVSPVTAPLAGLVTYAAGWH